MFKKFVLQIMMIALTLAAMPLLAHHGWNGNGDTQIELTGIVDTPVSLSGPHGTMKILVNGQVWDITLAPPARTRRAGLEPETIPVGAEVTVSGHRNSDPARFEIKTERVMHAGRTYNVYPDRD